MRHYRARAVPGVFMFAVSNGGFREPVEAAVMKATGNLEAWGLGLGAWGLGLGACGAAPLPLLCRQVAADLRIATLRYFLGKN